jgi:hexosaminidase
MPIPLPHSGFKKNGRKIVNNINFKFLLIFIFVCFCKNIYSQELNLTVVPKPKEITKINEVFSLSEGSISIQVFGQDTSGLGIPVNELKENFNLIKDYDFIFDQSSSRLIQLGIPTQNKKFKEICEKHGLVLHEKVGEEGYSLIIKNDLILIAANTKAGVYYGVQTIKQLLRGNQKESALPGLKIIDYPSLKYRGILDDISRGPVPTIAYMKQQIRRLAELKMNSLQYYTENVVLTEKHPAFAPPDGAVTIEEFKELSEYAKQYHVTLIGNFQSFGHFEKILSHPDYAHLGEGGTLLSPAFPEGIELLRDIYLEMVPAFSSSFFNVNSDETFDLGKGASKPMVDSLGIAVVYTDQIKKMYDILQELNVQMMMWTDILEKNPESIEMLPKDIIMMTWGYDAASSFTNKIEPFKNAGYQFTISPGILNSYSTMPDYSVTMTNIKNFAKDGIELGALGMVLTVWDDGGSAFFSRDWYGVAYGADQSWNPTEDTYDEFNVRFNPAAYGDLDGSLSSLIWKLVNLSNISVTDRLQEKLLWTKVIPDSGASLRMSLEDWDKVISILDSAESIYNNSDPLLYKRDYDYFKFTIDQYRYFTSLRFNLIHAARSYENAFRLSTGNRNDVREFLIDAIAAISSSRHENLKLQNFYKELWLRENKTHAVDLVLKDYGRQLNDLTDIESRIFNSLKEFDKRNEIPSPIDVRLAIEESDGKYFREWMMINPIPMSDGSKGNQIDYLADMGGELNAQPKVTQEFEYEGNTYRWRRTESDLFDVVDLAEQFPEENQNVITYAYANIDSPDERIVKASFGSTDGADIFINGKLAHSIRKERLIKIDEEIFEIPLHKGRNHLMIKLFQGSGDWKFTFQLPEYKVSNSKNRYTIPD